MIERPRVPWVTLVVGALVAACAPAGGDARGSSGSIGVAHEKLTDGDCTTLETMGGGDDFPQCTHRSAEAEAIWPAAQDPVEDYPEGDDDATRAKQEQLCQHTYFWFGQHDPKNIASAQLVCLGNDYNLKQYYKKVIRKQAPSCVWLNMVYALSTTPRTAFDAEAKDPTTGLKTHFSPCRNRLFVQCLLHGKITRGPDKTSGSDLGSFPESPTWTLGPDDPALSTGELLDAVSRGDANSPSFTSSEMCAWKTYTGSFPAGKSQKQAEPI